MKKAFWILLFISSSALCQQDKLITHFIFDKMSINPGFTGIELENGFCGTTIYRNQWDKVNGAPNSAILNVQGDLSRYFPGGVGISFYHDAIGFNRQNNVLLNYSYPLQVGSAGVLGIGIGFGIMNFGQDPNWIPPTSNPDPSLPSKWSATNLDLNFGLYFKGSDYYVGLSSTHLNQGLLEGAQANVPGQNVFPNFQSSRHYYLMGGKKFPKIAGGDIDANVLLRTDLVKFSADLNARYIYDNKMYGGLTYRTSDAIAFMLGYKPMNELTVGYSYDLTINKLASVSRGTHELFVKYCILLPPPPIQKARHPRWL
jgi:type IX secretion system PorP/SprF family membrane protein